VAFGCGLLLLLAAATAAPTPAPASWLAIAIVIDDLGENLSEGRRVLRLPGPVAVAILPHTPHATRLAHEAQDRRKEVILHLPMEALGENEAGPGRLDTTMPALELRLTLDDDLRSVPRAIGVSNHMGSRLTQDRPAMETLMQALRARGLFFIDSRTTPDSIAAPAASAQGVPLLVRQVFLDNDRHPAAIEVQFEELLRLAQRQGQALAIGHPYPETLAVLERRLPHLAERQIQLISLSAMLKRQPENPTWPLSSFPSPKAPKNSRP
jgi:polysaccharide deacetylase 2 family uncharacterized protein YibQ